MNTASTLLTVSLCMLIIVSALCVNAQDFEKRKISDRVFIIGKVDESEGQVVIESQKGLVIVNSFLSATTSKRYRDAIEKLSGRNDFLYLINIVDRLDRCGGNSTYEGIPIVGHKAFLDKFENKESLVREEVDRLIDMWRWKENVERERLPTLEPGSERAIGSERWMNACRQRVEDLESGFSLVLPTEVYTDRRTIDLGDITLNLIWFGRAWGEAMTVIVIPEEKLAILPDDAFSPLHLAPYPHSAYKQLDIPRWIAVMEEVLEGENAVDNVLLCDFLNVLWSRERAHMHLDYMRRLWNGVREADAQGMSLSQVYERFSLDNEFAFVKDFPVYVESGDEWVRPQHNGHIKVFFLQGKNVASATIRNSQPESLPAAIADIRKQWEDGVDIYIDERELNAIGYELLNQERLTDAVLVFRLNVDVYPESANVYDSYAEALMKSGDSEGAIRNYKKSLELNPENENAREMLRRLQG